MAVVLEPETRGCLIQQHTQPPAMLLMICAASIKKHPTIPSPVAGVENHLQKE